MGGSHVGGAQHRGPHMETQRGPSTDGACAGTISFNDSYGLGRHGAVHLLLFSVLLHYTSNVYIYIYVVRICVLDLTKTGSAWMNVWDMYAIAAYIYIGPLRHQLKMHWRTSATGTSTLAELRVRGHLGSSSRQLAPATTIKKC